MSITHPANLNLAIPDNAIDQIIGITTGSFTLAAPTAMQGSTTGSNSFAHGFGDSCYFQGIFTQNGGTTWNDFGAQTPNLSAPGPFFQSVDVEAYVDTTNIYPQAVNWYDVVHSTSSSYTVNYKIYLLAKNTMASSITPIATNNILYYNSNNNFQKIAFSGTVAINVAGGSTGSSATITHNLGYIPKIRAFYIASGKLFALNQVIPLVVAGSPQGAPQIEAHLTTTTLIFYTDQSGIGAPGVNGNIDYRIYLDS